MARGNDPGRDFDRQFGESRRRGQDKAARGESHWAQDKYLERMKNQSTSGPAHHAKDSCVVGLALLGGIAWALTETVQRFV